MSILGQYLQGNDYLHETGRFTVDKSNGNTLNNLVNEATSILKKKIFVDDDFLLTSPDFETMELQLSKLAIQLRIAENIRNLAIKNVLDDFYDYSVIADLKKRPKVTTIWVYGDRAIEYAENGLIKTFEKKFQSMDDLYTFIEKKMSITSFRYARNIPEIDTILPDGSRFHIMQGSSGISKKNEKGIALTSKMPILTIRLFSYPYQLQEIINDNKLLTYLSYLPKANQSFLVSGNQGSGKTTLLNAIVGHTKKNCRLIIIEEAPEMQPNSDNIIIRLWNQGELNDFFYVNMIKNTRATLRMTGDAMIIGEIRDEETSWEFLKTSNTGLSFVASSIHANSAQDAPFRLLSLCLASPHHPPKEAILDFIHRGITHFIHLHREGDHKGIEEVVEVVGTNIHDIELRTVFKRNPSGGFDYFGLSNKMKNTFVSANLSIRELT